jgi:hypothetical protein
MESKNLLIEFLQKEGIFEKFKKNFDPEFAYMQIDEYLETYASSVYAINDPFKWGKSQEGYYFWNKIYDKWEDCLLNKEDKLISAIVTLKTYNQKLKFQSSSEANVVSGAIDLVLNELKARL